MSWINDDYLRCQGKGIMLNPGAYYVCGLKLVNNTCEDHGFNPKPASKSNWYVE